ncbi:MAG TPA: universal stress protein [Nocardioidaceae bacterium]|nr:universal stress protein [Nocardioidaceae bacterium]
MARNACVVVGVDDLPVGLRALRTAVTQARLLQRDLLAVRAFSAPPDREQIRTTATAGWLTYAPPTDQSQTIQRFVAAREQDALRTVERAFVQAMGDVPDDVSVSPTALLGSPGQVLVQAAFQDEDLLVVGAQPRRRLRGFRRSIGRYCLDHAKCPVLLVPPNDLARKVDRMHRPWRWRDLDKLFADGGSTRQRPTDGGGGGI